MKNPLLKKAGLLFTLLVFAIATPGCNDDSKSSSSLKMSGLKIAAPSFVPVSTDFTITVTAIDQNGDDFAGYTGTVTVSATNLTATGLSLTFDGSSASMSITDAQISTVADNVVITASDGTYTDTTEVTVYTPALTGLKVVAPPVVQVSTDFTITVTSIDQNGNAITGYTGTVTVSASDLTSATGLSLTFDGTIASMSITNAQISAVADNVVITASDGTYSDTTEISTGNIPAASFAKVITVSGSNIAGVNGTYTVNETYDDGDGDNTVINGWIYFKNSSTNYYIWYCTCFCGWKITTEDLIGGGNHFAFAGNFDTPPSGVWSGGCLNPGHAITVTSYDIRGDLIVGSVLSVPDHSFSDPDGDAEGSSTYKWYRCDDKIGTNDVEIPGATAQTYTTVAADEDKYIKFEVTPVDEHGLAGAPVSIISSMIIIDPPLSIVVSGAGESSVNGTYTYTGMAAGYPVYQYGSFFISVYGCYGWWNLSEGRYQWANGMSYYIPLVGDSTPPLSTWVNCDCYLDGESAGPTISLP